MKRKAHEEVRARSCKCGRVHAVRESVKAEWIEKEGCGDLLCSFISTGSFACLVDLKSFPKHNN